METITAGLPCGRTCSAVNEAVVAPPCCRCPLVKTKRPPPTTRRWPPRTGGRVAALLLPLLVAAAFFSACGSASNAVESNPSPTATATAEPTPTAEPMIDLQACWDLSGSYPPQLRIRAMAEFEDMLRDILRPGFPGVRVTEHWITHKSRSPEAPLYGFTIEAIPDEPVRGPDPPEPVPPDRQETKYIYDEERYQRDLAAWEATHAEWQAAVDAIQNDYDAALAELESALQAGRQAIETRHVALSNVEAPVAQATDLGGCLQAAADGMAHAQGRKIIVIASDMAPYGEQDIYNPNLSETEVYIVYYWCDHAVECEERTHLWAETLAPAASVDYYTPGEDIKGILRERTD